MEALHLAFEVVGGHDRLDCGQVWAVHEQQR
jgi:hypothetical protein